MITATPVKVRKVATHLVKTLVAVNSTDLNINLGSSRHKVGFQVFLRSNVCISLKVIIMIFYRHFQLENTSLDKKKDFKFFAVLGLQPNNKAKTNLNNQRKGFSKDISFFYDD